MADLVRHSLTRTANEMEGEGAPAQRPHASLTRALVAPFAGVLALLSLVSWQSLPALARDYPRRVLMLHAFNYTFPATTRIAEVARKRLLERFGEKLEIDTEFLDLARTVDPEHEVRIAEFLRQKYARTPPD